MQQAGQNVMTIEQLRALQQQLFEQQMFLQQNFQLLMQQQQIHPSANQGPYIGQVFQKQSSGL